MFLKLLCLVLLGLYILSKKKYEHRLLLGLIIICSSSIVINEIKNIGMKCIQ